MKLITLNTWGGKLFDPLINFLKDSAEDVDIFCFQEIYSSPKKREIAREMRSNLFQEISDVLKDHQGYFAPHLKSYDLDGKVDFDLWSGLAIFVRKSINVQKIDEISLYREGYELLNEDIKTVPRNLQYAMFTDNGQEYLIGHLHGVWYPKSKLDNKERIGQSRRIKIFFDSKTGKKILCGDFNLLPETESMKILEEGRRNLIKEFKIETTRNEHYQREEKHADYVLVSKDVDVIDFKMPNVTVSDHQPLLLEFF